MIEPNLTVQLKGLETQLAVLKARMKQQSATPQKSFASLYGLLEGKGDFSEREIKAARYRVKCASPRKRAKAK